MSCCFFNFQNCCRRSCCRVPMPPMPPVVPFPVPQPTAPETVYSYTLTPETEVAAGETLPLTPDYAPSVAQRSALPAAEGVESGRYIVGYTANATAQNATAELTFALNGNVVDKSRSSAYSDDTGGATLASVFVLYVPANDSTVELINTGGAATQYSGVNLVLRKLNA